MYALEKIKSDIAKELGKLIKFQVPSTVFVAPPQPDMADLSLPCFAFAQGQGKNPAEMAREVASQLEKKKWIARAASAGPYVNIFLNSAAKVALLDDITKYGQKYGSNPSGKKQRVMIEYSNANTHKESHIGHLRNIAYGDAVNRILAANGYKVIPVSYINDFGIHVAKTLWWLYHEHNEEARKLMKDGLKNKGYFLGRQYAEATLRIEEKENAKAEVSEVMKAIESRRGDMYKIWKKTRQWSIDQFDQMYKELGIRFAATFYESEFIDRGLKMVQELRDKGVLVESEGAVIANLEQYKLGVLVVLRSDGTALYPVADLPLAIHKIKQYKLDASLYVVDIRQGLYFSQLFKLLELLGFAIKFEHLPYDFVKLPSGMMSSRTGNIIPYEDLKNMALEKASEEIKKRHTDWTTKKVNAAARVIAFGALKFEMTKVSSEKQITFDVEEALRFDGFTAAYLQYSFARIQSIARKAPKNLLRNPDFAQLNGEGERLLIMKAADFPAAVAAAGAKKDPAEIAKYLFSLAQLANDYYHAVPVLKADQATAAARLALLKSIAFVLEQGLNLLGIEVVDEM